MADIPGPLRPSDSWSSTEVRAATHSHVWTVKGFSQCECRYLETSVKLNMQATAGTASSSSAASPANAQDHTTFRIRLHPQGNKESNKDFTFFQVFNNNQTYKFKAKFCVYNSRNEEITTTVYTGTQQLHGYFEYIRRDLLLNHILPSDELQLVLTLTSTFDTVTKTSQASRPTLIESKQEDVGRDLGHFLHADNATKLTDFKLLVGEEGSETVIKCHRAILAARSPVFAAMMESHTTEAQSSQVALRDMDAEVMQELLEYVYSGKSPQLSGMASELLAAADRFALPGLKDMAEQVLRASLSSETVCRILVLADMHTAEELKTEAVRFVAQNSASIIHTEGWADMLKSHVELVTEVVAAISAEKEPGLAGKKPVLASSSASTSDSAGPAASKRPRYSN